MSKRCSFCTRLSIVYFKHKVKGNIYYCQFHFNSVKMEENN